MRTKKIFLLLGCCAIFAGCENNSDELISSHSAISSRSVASSYYLDGANELYTGTPETYTLKKIGSSSLDGVYVTNWNYSSDLYRVDYDNISITLGRKIALGEYTISASLSNGESVSKQITAKDNAASNPVQTIANSIFVRPVGVSRDINGPYDNIDNYRYGTGQSYNMASGDDLCLKCKIENKTSSSVHISLSSITFAYGESSEKYAPKSIVYENLSSVSSYINIAGDSSVIVIFYLGYEWYRYILSNKVTIFKPYYSYYTIGAPGYGYLLTR